MGAQAKFKSALDTSLIVLWSCVFKTAAQTKNTWVMNLALPFIADEVSCEGSFKETIYGAGLLGKAWNPMRPGEVMQSKVNEKK